MRLLGSMIIAVAPLAFTASANAVVIDFEVLESPAFIEVDQGYYYEEDGFALENLGAPGRTHYEFGSYGTNSIDFTGSTALFNNTDNGLTRLSKTDGGAFDLVSIDLARLGTVMASSRDVSVTFIANTGHAQTFTGLALDGSPTTYIFDPGFTGITSVTWRNQSWYHQFDNIVVTAVPVPAAAWLFVSALGVAFSIRRKPRPAGPLAAE